MVLHMLRKLIISLLCIMLLAGTMPAASFAVDAADGESSNTNAQETIQEPAQNTEGSASDSDTATNDPAATSQPQTSGSAEEATVPEAADISEEAAAKIQATFSLTAADPADNSKVKWIENRKVEIGENETLASLLTEVLKETGGMCKISDAGIISEITGPEEYGCGNQTLGKTDEWQWGIRINNKIIDPQTNIHKISVSKDDNIEIFYSDDPYCVTADESDQAVSVMAANDEISYAYGNTKDKLLASYSGETWDYEYSFDVIGLARAGSLTQAQKDAFYKKISSQLQNRSSSSISDKDSSDNSKTIIALTAIGKNASNVDGYNMLEPLANFSYLTAQGVNGPLWALIAFDSGNYTIPAAKSTGQQVTRDRLVNYLINSQHNDGGWAYSGSSDIDMTAMIIQGLAPYYKSNANARAAVDRGLAWLSSHQNSKGCFTTGTVSSESQSQVIVALTSLGINPETDARFVKNGKNAVDALLSFYVAGGGYKHVSENWKANGLATTQGNYALTALYRYRNGANGLYQMSDNNSNYKIDENYKSDKRTPVDPAGSETKTAKATASTKALGLIKAKGNLSRKANACISQIKSINRLNLSGNPADYSREQIKAIGDAYSAYLKLDPATKLAVQKDKSWKKYLAVTEQLGQFYHYDRNEGIDLRNNNEKTLPWYIRLEITQQDMPAKKLAKIKSILGEESKVLSSYDVKLVNTLTGRKWEPDGIVNVKFNINDDAGHEGNLNSIVVVHIGRNGRIEFIDGQLTEDKTAIKVKTTEFSLYATCAAAGDAGSLTGTREVTVLPWIIGAAAAILIVLVLLIIRRRIYGHEG